MITNSIQVRPFFRRSEFTQHAFQYGILNHYFKNLRLKEQSTIVEIINSSKFRKEVGLVSMKTTGHLINQNHIAIDLESHYTVGDFTVHYARFHKEYGPGQWNIFWTHRKNLEEMKYPSLEHLKDGLKQYFMKNSRTD